MSRRPPGNQAHPWSTKTPTGPGDTIVVGSGMGGMTCAALLARLGQRVLVLEHHYVPGGFTQTFTRKGWTWDVGVHAVGEVDERALLGKVLRELSGQRLHWASLGPVYDTFEFPDFRIDFSSDRRAFQDALQAAFPSQRAAIAAYGRVTREVGGAMRAYYQLHTGEIVTFIPETLTAAYRDARWRRRGETYEALKKDWSARLLAQLFRHMPALKPYLDWVELSTPATTETFTRAPRGAIYGLEPTPDRYANRYLRPATPIPGLYLASGDMASVGVMGAMVGGLLCATAISPIRALRHLRGVFTR